MREQYLSLTSEAKAHYQSIGRAGYAVYEEQGKKNHFTEVFVLNSMEEFDTLEDNPDERAQDLVGRMADLVDKGGMKYSTLVEVE
jgi:hypothetical protein